MKLTPINSNLLFTKNKINFKSNEDDPDHSMLKTYAFSAVTGLGLLIGMQHCSQNILNDYKRNTDRIFDKYELQSDLYTVKPDTLELKDVTGDNFPELILYKSDGSKVIIDISECKKISSELQ